MEIKDKVIIVTGASQGIGAATAKYLADQGAKVVLIARSEEKLKELAAGLKGALAIKGDLRQENDITNLIAQTLNKYSRIDILINNAGQGIYGPVEKINIDEYREIMELNLYGALRMMQVLIPIMREQGGGQIINVSSAVTKHYYPGMAAYSSSKYALNALSYTARQELAADKIIISSIMPKMTETNFGKNSLGTRPQWVTDSAARRDPSLVIDSADKVAQVIGELIRSGEAEAFV
ncbi:MAG: SDR family NAD(P)-dependent oxidoreductase [Patescibacteria group bacterium]